MTEVAWPFYIVCDVSASMHARDDNDDEEMTPYEAMQEGLLDLIDFALDHVAIADIAHIGLITFADDPQLVLPLTKLSDGIEFGPLPKGHYTDYAKALQKVSEVVRADLTAMQSQKVEIKRPAAFFITDGSPVVGGRTQPLSAWQDPLQRLHSTAAARLNPEKEPLRIAVVALGFGAAECDNLIRISQLPGLAFQVKAGTSSSPGELMSNLLNSILRSVADSVSGDDLVFEAPPDMELCQP